MKNLRLMTKKAWQKAILLAISFILFPLTLQAKVNIFACEPEWGSLASEIGGNEVKIFNAISANQDPHYIRAKPSLIAKIRLADLLICSGADLEVGWLPILLQKASLDLQPGKVGNLMASDFVQTIERPKAIDRSMGDLHPQGNPHIHLDPNNILKVAQEIKNRLLRIDSENSAIYEKNYKNFAQKWRVSIKKWQRTARSLKNVNVITHHKSFNYLLNWLQINELATLESKPGIAPNSKHLQSLLEKVRKNKVEFIIRTPYDNDDASNWLAKKSGLQELVLPYTVGGTKNSNDLFLLFD